MSVAYKFKYLNETKRQIKEAIIEKNVLVEEGTPFREYADKILKIQLDMPISGELDVIIDFSLLPSTGFYSDPQLSKYVTEIIKANTSGITNLSRYFYQFEK